MEGFWPVLVSTAAALAGFTLASYSIFVSRIEIAAADATCRRYLFRECTSQYSLAFIMFAMIMFLMPLALGTVALIPLTVVDDPWRGPVGVGVIVIDALLLFLTALINIKQFRYETLFIRYRKAKLLNDVQRSSQACFRPLADGDSAQPEQSAKCEGPQHPQQDVDCDQTTALSRNSAAEPKPNTDYVSRTHYDSTLCDQSMKRNRGERKPHDRSHFSVAVAMLLVSLFFFVVSLLHVNLCLKARAGIQIFGLDAFDWFTNAIPSESAATVSLFLGVVLVIWHFYIFEPARLVFETDSETEFVLNETCLNVNETLKRIAHVQSWLRRRVEKAQAILANQPSDDETVEAQKLLGKAAEFLQGTVTVLGVPGRHTLECRSKHHFKWLAFCCEQEVILLRDIIGNMNGVDMYLLALSSYEQQLKEMPQQLPFLFEPLDQRRSAKSRRRSI